MTDNSNAIAAEPVQDAEARAAVADLATYKWGFSTDIESEMAPKGLNEDTVRYLSAKKAEPQWLLDWRLKAYRRWLTMETPDWAKLDIAPIDYQDRALGLPAWRAFRRGAAPDPPAAAGAVLSWLCARR